MQVDLKAVGNRVVINSSGESAGTDQGVSIETASLCDQTKFVRCVSREPAATAADVKAELIRFWCKPALQRAHDGSCDTGRVPIHTHHRAESLEPKRIAQA